jgi:hypothetical protein
MLRSLVVVSFLVWAFLWGVPGAAQAALDDVAVETEAAQGLTGFNYTVFSSMPAVSDGTAGKRVAFVANARKPPPGAMTKTCLFADDTSGTGAKIACVNDAAPASRVFRPPFRQPSMNAGGDVAWSSGLNTDGNGNHDGVFWWNGTTVDFVVFAGDDNDVGDILEQFREVVKISSFVVFRAMLDTGVEEIYRCDDSDNCSSSNGGFGTNLDFLLGEGSAANGRDICAIKSVAASDHGIAVIASTDTTGNCSTPDDPQDAVIRMAFGGSNDIIALTGGSPVTGTTYTAFSGRPAINGSGTVAFLASVTGDTNANVIYLCDTSCPGTDPSNLVETNTLDGDFLLKSFSSPVVDDSDLVAFTARVKDVTQSQQFDVVYTVNGALTQIAVGLTPSPVTDTIFQHIQAPSMSPGGNIAFESILRRTAAPKVARDAIFLFE